MSTLLHIDSSGKSTFSVTQPLTAYFAEKWKQATPGGKIIYRHLGDSNLQFLNAEVITGFNTPSEKLSEEQKSLLKQSDELLAELEAADIYLFGVPMYNFSVPAVFKAYIDLVVRANKTFSFAGGAPKGLLANKKLVVVTASGADYSSGPAKAMDFIEPYVRAIMTFIGVTDITFIKAHGTNPEAINASSEQAKRAIDELIPQAVGSRAN